MKIRILITAFLILLQSRVECQTVSSNMAFPSSGNSFLNTSTGSSSEVNVNLYSGAAQVNLPICILNSRQLNVPVSLRYIDGQGVKVQEYSSSVGLGWQLNAGGSISREIRGLPDETLNGYIGPLLWGQQVVKSPLPSEFSKLPSQITGNGGRNTPTADGEPDLFFVKTPFFSFHFTFDEYGNAVISENTGMKISSFNFYDKSNTANSHFIVTDPSGNQYFFGSTSASVENITATFFGSSYEVPITWYLDKIVEFNSADSIVFNYTSSSDVTLKHYYDELSYLSPSCENLVDASFTYTYNQPKNISSIVSSQGEIDFNYAFDRTDITNAVRLSSISLFQGSSKTLLRTYTLNYSYFGEPSSNPNILRLKLDSITLAGNTTATSTPVTIYSLGYNTSTNLPDRSLINDYDYWGYYVDNSDYNADAMLYPNYRYPVLSTMEADVLNSVKGIGGDSWTIAYGENNYNNTNGVNIAVGGLRVQSISHTLTEGAVGDNLQTNYSYNDNSGNSTGEIFNNDYASAFTIDINNGGVYLNLSETPADIYDLNGIFVGYSKVTVTNQNGGYSIYSFKNFSDFQDSIVSTNSPPNFVESISPAVSFAYKRGLLKDVSVFNSSGTPISEDIYNYSSLNSITSKSWAIHWIGFSGDACGQSAASYDFTYYHSDVENYRLVQTVHKDYDEMNSSNYIQTTTNYTYASNNRLVKTISTTNSKGETYTQTFYHTEDSDIPMLTSGETSAISQMLAANNLNEVIHTIDNRNGSILQEHNSFSSFQYGSGTKVFLAEKNYYNSNTLIKQESFNYDPGTSLETSENIAGGPYTSIGYGYNSALPVVEVENANNTVSYTDQTTTQNGTLYISPNNWGNQVVSFTTFASGTITIAMPPGSYLAGSVSCYFAFSLTGPSGKSGDLCNSSSSSYTCSSPNSISYANMPAGTYTLTVTPYTNTASSNVPVTYTYPGYTIQKTTFSEFYYEGFESNPYASFGNAHTGNAYYNSSIYGPFYVSFTPPNNRSYTIQWWSLNSGVWTLNQQAYTSPISLSGDIDDIRIFPSDAQMTTYTYSPLVGKTSELDPSGHKTSTVYDGLQRPQLILDNDNNILKEYSYTYQAKALDNIYLSNISGVTSSSIYVTLDGVQYQFPASGANPVLAISVTPGTTHTLSFSCGPEFYYKITPPGTSYYCANTQPAINYTVNSDITLTCYQPSSSTSFVGNLTSDVTNANACSCTGCQYTTTVYISSNSLLGPGTQLYYDSNLTQPVTGKTWFMSYTDETKAWPLNSSGVITGSAMGCPQ